MSRYIVLLEGTGEGCDYSIDCNKTWVELKAHSIEAAHTEVAGIVDEHGEDTIERATILAVAASEQYDVAAHWRVKQAAREAEERAAIEQQERNNYERLRAKFGGSA